MVVEERKGARVTHDPDDYLKHTFKKHQHSTIVLDMIYLPPEKQYYFKIC